MDFDIKNESLTVPDKTSEIKTEPSALSATKGPENSQPSVSVVNDVIDLCNDDAMNVDLKVESLTVPDKTSEIKTEPTALSATKGPENSQPSVSVMNDVVDLCNDDAIDFDLEIESLTVSEKTRKINGPENSCVNQRNGRGAVKYSRTAIVTRRQAQLIAEREKLVAYLKTLQFGWVKFKRNEKFLPGFVHSIDSDGKTRAQWLTLANELSDKKLEFERFESIVSENYKDEKYVRALEKLNNFAGTSYK